MEVIRLSVSAGRSLARGQEMSALLGMWASGDFQKQDSDSYLRAQLIPLTRRNDTQGSAFYTEKVRSSRNACGRGCWLPTQVLPDAPLENSVLRLGVGLGGEQHLRRARPGFLLSTPKAEQPPITKRKPSQNTALEFLCFRSLTRGRSR